MEAPRWARWLVGANLVGLVAAGVWLATRDTTVAPPTGTDKPSFLIIMPDTLRGDRVGAVRDGKPVTPNIDALAAKGARFTHMYSQSGWTLPALAAFLSGRWPLAPKESQDQALDFMRSDKMTLPELLTAAGYNTAVFWGPGISEAAPEFSRGFVHVGKEEGTDFSAGVLTWLTEADRRPFFAVVHNTDLQFPTAAVPGHELYAMVPPSAPIGMEPVYNQFVRIAGPEKAAATMAAAYDSVVSRYDAAVGKMVAGLEKAGLDDDTVVMVTSNHGVDLGERGHYFHGTVYDTNLHVPLVVYDPKMEGGRTVDTVVQTLDLAPTLFARAGVAPPEGLPGASILPLLGLADGTYPERPVFSLCSTASMSVRTPAYKVARVAPKDDPADTKIQAFDLAADPGELHELTGALPPEAAALRDQLTAWWTAREAELGQVRPSGRDSTALKQALKDNGYWGLVNGDGSGTGGKAMPGGMPAPDGGKSAAGTLPPIPGGISGGAPLPTPPVGAPGWNAPPPPGAGGPMGPPGVFPPPPGQALAAPPPPNGAK